MFVQILPPSSLVSTLITGISYFLMFRLDVLLQIITPDTLVITLVTLKFLKVAVVLFLLMFVKTAFQLCFVFTLITVYVVDVVVDLIMFLKIFFSSSGVVTGGTPKFFFIVFFVNFLYVLEVARLTVETFITKLTLFLCVGFPFMFLKVTDIL